MLNIELYRIARSCSTTSDIIDITFEKSSSNVSRYDIFEFKHSGAFVKSTSTEFYIWPKTLNQSLNEDSLYIVESVKEDFYNDETIISFIPWSFSNKTILGKTDETCDIMVTDDLIKHLPRELGIQQIDNALLWLKNEFLFNINQNESFFFRILGNNDFDSFWLGRNRIAKIVEQEIGGKKYFVIESIKRSPQKALNVQKGRANIRFVHEKEKIEANPAFMAQFIQSSSDPNSIINLWKNYNDVDKNTLMELKEKSGCLEIENIRSENGKICATIQNNKKCIEQFKAIYETLKDDYDINIYSARDKKNYTIDTHFFEPDNNKITWTWRTIPHHQLKDAKLKIDFKPWEVASKRREEALTAIRSRNIPIPSITDILNKVSIPSFDTPFRHIRLPKDAELKKAFGNHEPNESQLKALKICLSSPEIALVQGPPGTGKTSVISALLNVLQTVDHRHPQAVPSVLLTSFQHVAVDNVAANSKIWGLPVFRFYGAQKDKEQLFSGLKDWQEQTAHVIDQQMSSLNIDEKFKEYEQLQQWLYAIKDAESAYEIRILLQDIINLAEKENFLTAQEIDILRDWKQKFSEIRINNTFYRLLMSIRISKTSFEDDGATNIIRLLNYYDLQKDSQKKSTLEDGYEKLKSFIDSLPQPADFEWIENLRNRCIAEMLPNTAIHFDKSLFEQLKNYINKITLDIKERLKHSDLQLMQILKEYRETIEFKSIRYAMLKYAVTYAATTQHSKSEAFVRLLGEQNFGFDYVIIDEAARANPLDLFIPITLARKKVILVGDHRQLPQLVDQKILEQMVDENHQQKDLKKYMEEPLFESLWTYLKNERNDGIERTVTLDIQYRMPQKLGDFISKNFYGAVDKIKTGKRQEDSIHCISRYKKKNGECKCAVWENVEGKESGSTSKTNEAEADRIIQRLMEIIHETNETIGVIASYSAQVKLIEKKIKQHPELVEALSKTQLEIGSVDAFQGRQFNIVFFSVVRSNEQSIFGFLKMENRLNVAFTRQQKILIVVGNRQMYESEKAKKEVPALNAFIELVDSEDA